MKPALGVTTIFLTVVAVGHLLRLLFRVEVTAGSMIVPMWMSVIACVFTGGLAIVLWRENRRK